MVGAQRSSRIFSTVTFPARFFNPPPHHHHVAHKVRIPLSTYFAGAATDVVPNYNTTHFVQDCISGKPDNYNYYSQIVSGVDEAGQDFSAMELLVGLEPWRSLYGPDIDPKDVIRHVWCGCAGIAATPHFDVQHNHFVQVRHNFKTGGYLSKFRLPYYGGDNFVLFATAF